MRRSWKGTLWGVLALVGLLGTAEPGGTEDNALTRESLRELPGVRVLIEALPAAITRTGLTETLLQTTVMGRLRNAGVHMLTAAEWQAVPGAPLLYIQVQAVESVGAYAYAIRVQLFQQVALARSLICTHAITWDTGSVGLVGAAYARNTLRKAVGIHIGQFGTAYRAINPRNAPAFSRPEHPRWELPAVPTNTVPPTAVQDRLNALGYEAGPSDGLLGKRTQAALRQFQEAVGLPVTGQPDAATHRALGLAEISWQ